MACASCKKKRIEKPLEYIVDDKNSSLPIKIRNIFLKIVVFLVLCVIVLPLIIPATLVVLFRLVMTKEGINLVPLLLFIGNKFFPDEEEEEEDDEEGDEYELEDEDEITVIK